MSERKKIIIIIVSAVLLFAFGFIARGRNDNDLKNRLSKAVADSTKLRTELADARSRVKTLESELDGIRGTAGRIGVISGGLEDGISGLEKTIRRGAESGWALTTEHRASGEYIGELGEILERYGTGSKAP